MKKMLTIILMMGSMVFSQSDLNIIGGITNSTVAGDDVDEDEVDYQMGFRFGVDRTLTNGLIVGATYTQRGYSMDDLDAYSSYDTEYTINYLTGFLLKPLPMQSGMDLLVGGEVGYFWSAAAKTKMCEYNDCNSERETIDGDDWEDADNNMFDYGLVFGGRYKINEQMYLYGTYYWGLAQMNDDYEVNHRGFQINISYALN